MDYKRITDLISLFERYNDFYLSYYDQAAAIFYDIAKSTQDKKLKKYLVIRIYSEMMNSCENVLRLIRILHDRSTNPFENLLSKDLQYFSTKNLEDILNNIEQYKNEPARFLKEYLSIELPEDNLEHNKKAIKGILDGVLAALHNALISPKDVHRALWTIHNKIKHGAPIVDKDNNESVVVYLEKDKPVEFPTTIKDGFIWLETTYSLRVTMVNINTFVLGSLRQSKALIDALRRK